MARLNLNWLFLYYNKNRKTIKNKLMRKMITKPMLNRFRTDFAKAVAELEKEYGVNVNLGNITYDDNEFRTKMTTKLSSSTPTKNTLTQTPPPTGSPYALIGKKTGHRVGDL